MESSGISNAILKNHANIFTSDEIMLNQSRKSKKQKGQKQMKTIKNGAFVELHYKGTFPNGEIFDDSRARGLPMKVLVGSGQVIKGFDTALVGMAEGQIRTPYDYRRGHVVPGL